MRQLALAGTARGWAKQRGFFTVFDQEGYLEWQPRSEDCMLTPYGSLDNTAAEYPDRVQNLQAAGLSELEHRGADPILINWLKNGAEGQVPENCRLFDGWPVQRGFRPILRGLMAARDGGLSRARSRYPCRDIAGGEQMTRDVATSKRNFSLHRGFVRLLAEQRDPILKVLFSGRDTNSRTASPSSLYAIRRKCRRSCSSSSCGMVLTMSPLRRNQTRSRYPLSTHLCRDANALRKSLIFGSQEVECHLYALRRGSAISTISS